MVNTVHDIEIKKMISQAKTAKSRAYVPFSFFSVGACLKGASGAYYLGCNVENASFPLTNCAERTAIFKAISEGEKAFDAIAIISDSEKFTTPCGACRQVLAEFCDANMPVICAKANGEFKVFSVGELLPEAFTTNHMKE